MERQEDKKLSFSEIKEKLKQNSCIDTFSYDYHEQFIKCDLGEYKVIERVGGEEQGVEWYTIFLFIDHNIYAKLEGRYYSHDGVNFDGWEDFFEVTPKEVEVTQYQKV